MDANKGLHLDQSNGSDLRMSRRKIKVLSKSTLGAEYY